MAKVEPPPFLWPVLLAEGPGVGLDLAANTLPNAYPMTPHWVWILLFWAGILLTVPLPAWGIWWGVKWTRATVATFQFQWPLARRALAFGGALAPAATPTATPIAVPPLPEAVASNPVRDVWLRDAIWYAASGQWEPQPSDPSTADVVYQRLCDLCAEFRQRAFDSKLPIWSMDPDGLWRLVPTSHWADFQINYLFLINEKPETLHTEPVRLHVIVPGRDHLMTSKTAVTAFWTPPLRISLRDATEIAYLRLRDRMDLKVLVRLNGNDRSKIPGIVATMLFSQPGFGFPLYATRPPYHTSERVPDDDIRQQTFSDDASALIDSLQLGFDGTSVPHWSGLEIRRADLDRRLDELEA